MTSNSLLLRSVPICQSWVRLLKMCANYGTLSYPDENTNAFHQNCVENHKSHYEYDAEAKENSARLSNFGALWLRTFYQNAAV